MYDEHDSSPGPEGLPDALRNWQVWEIDGQATPVAEPPHPELTDENQAHGDPPPGAAKAQGRPEDLRGLQIEDRQDEVIIATLDNRRRQVQCGATATFAVSVLNNGEQPALFQVQLEGWLDPQWLADTTAAVLVAPGARATLRLPLSPPRRSNSEAGDYHFAVTVRSPQYPGRIARLGALLTVLPFDAVELRLLGAAEPQVSWFKRGVVLPLAVANRGNHPVEIELLDATRGPGVGSPAGCRLAFAAPANAAGAASVILQPNQGLHVPLRVEVPRPPLVGLHSRAVEVQVEGRIDGQTVGRARAEVLAQPLLGAWQLVLGIGLAAAGAVALLLSVALFYFLAQRSALLEAAPAPAADQVVAPAAPPVIIVNLNQPAAAPAQPVGAQGQGAQGAGGTAVSNFTAGASPDPALPLVLPDQVSAPDGVVPAAGPPLRIQGSQGGAPSSALALEPASARSAAGAGDANQTYGQMFQEVGRRFDLDWRMLAAQAYIESGFDSLALSDAGAMGLMQILPDTWREWALPAEVSDPFDAYSNVLVAAAYLDYLRSQLAAKGYPQTEWMLVAYNWGPDKVNNFLAGGGAWDALPQARRQYATEILRIAQTIP